MINKNFVASRIKDHKSNIVTKMWNIQQKLDDVIAMGRGDTDLVTTGTGYQDGIHQLQNIPPMETVDDPHLVGKALGGGPIGKGYQNVYGGINQYTGPTQERDGLSLIHI